MIGHIKNLENKIVDNPNALNTTMQVLISAKEGWDDYIMRVFEVGKNGYTPKHKHSWPHINFIIEGSGELFLGDKYNKVSAGSYAYIPGDTVHQFRNIDDKLFKFICIVPKEGHF